MEPLLRLKSFAEQLGSLIDSAARSSFADDCFDDDSFGALSLELFRIQVASNPCYRRLIEYSKVDPDAVDSWRAIPCVPTAAFKELDLTSLPAESRTHVFRSSGTTQESRGKHYHFDESLALYEKSLLEWFRFHLCGGTGKRRAGSLCIMTPSASSVAESSLIHMFDVVRRAGRFGSSEFYGAVTTDGGWVLQVERMIQALGEWCRAGEPVLLVGTAFNFVQLLDGLAEQGERLSLPSGSRLLETGGYKGRARELSKEELYEELGKALGVSSDQIVSEYGMSELSSQAYDHRFGTELDSSVSRYFRFAPWARVQVVSPETGLEVGIGEAGLIQVFDLTNVWSVMAIQTEDLGVRRDGGVELLGRAEMAEAKGCSLMPEA
jgi:hypothetical protein